MTASSDGTAHIADSSTGHTLSVLEHSDVVTDAAFVPGGEQIVTVSRDGTAKVWDAATGDEIRTLDHEGEAVRLARTNSTDWAGNYVATGAFTADGRYLVTSADDSAWVWDLSTGELVHQLKHEKLTLPSGETVSPGLQPGGNFSPGTVVESLFVFSAAFSPDGKVVVTGADDGKAYVWSVETGERALDPMDNETPWVTMATFSPDGKLIACALQDGYIGIWNAETGEYVEFRRNHRTEVKALQFSSDGFRLLSAGDKRAVVLDVTPSAEGETARLVSEMNFNASWIDTAEFSSDGEYVVTANQDGTARVASTQTGQELFVLGRHKDIVWTARFSPDGNRVVTSSEDGTVRVWQIDTGVDLVGHIEGVTSVSFSPDGQSVATASFDETVSVWDAASGEELKRFEGTDRGSGRWPFGSAVFHSAGKEVLTAQADGTVARWNVNTEEQIGTCCAREGWGATFAEFVPGVDDRIVVLYEDSSVHVWDVSGDAAGKDIKTFDTGSVFGYALSPDGQTIVTIGRDDKMARAWGVDWSTNTFTELNSWEVGLVSSIGYSPDSRRVVTSGFDGVVRVWDTSNGSQVKHDHDDQLRAGASNITTVTFSVDGKWILAGGADGTIRIWTADKGQLLADLRVHSSAINSISTNDDAMIATASDDRSAKVFACSICGPIGDVVAQAREQLKAGSPMEGH